MTNDPRHRLLGLVDAVMDSATKPIEEAIEQYCVVLGHEFIDDQCNKPEHRFCVWCHAPETPT